MAHTRGHPFVRTASEFARRLICSLVVLAPQTADAGMRVEINLQDVRTELIGQNDCGGISVKSKHYMYILQ